ncbi:MAG: hypothetical protein MK086_12810 [Flavobacteriales bacterium]|nr:hypothetical protein [Flavobacteriales bacterium]
MQRSLYFVFFAVVFLTSHFLISITSRGDFEILLISIFFAFTAWVAMLRESTSIRRILPLALVARFVFYWNLPMLSDDFYRFIWDGSLILDGLNPVGRIPLDTTAEVPNAQLLLDTMNSPNYPSVYPPLHQLGMTFGSLFSGLNAQVNGMRLFILVFEILGFWYFFKKSPQHMKWYLLYLINPLVITEGTGNVHFEAALLPLVAIASHQIGKKQIVGTALSMAGAILIKLNPLMLIPAFWSEVKSFKFVAINGLIVLLGFLPFLSGFNESLHGIDLFFRSFEFNASIYYLVSEIGKSILGYNPISVVGPLLALVSLTLILFISFGKDKLYDKILFIYLIFLLFSSTVHPWYIIPVVYFSISAGRQLIAIWSFTAFFSYTHYLGELEPKYPWLIAEYVFLLGAIICEWRKRPLQLFLG